MAEKEGNITPPNWNPKDVLAHAKSLPSSSDAGKIPPRVHLSEFKGLPASTMPKPLKMEGH